MELQSDYPDSESEHLNMISLSHVFVIAYDEK